MFFAIDHSTSCLPANTESALINILQEFTDDKKACNHVKCMRTLQISNAMQSEVQGEVLGFVHINHQKDAHVHLLKILDILHNHNKICLFPILAFSQEAIKYSLILRNIIYVIINCTHTCTACQWATTTSSNFYQTAITLENGSCTGKSMSKYYNCATFC